MSVLQISKRTKECVRTVPRRELKDEPNVTTDMVVSLAEAMTERKTAYVETADYIYMYVAVPTQQEIIAATEPRVTNIEKLN
jgi:disulfide oxidoreductase YuzD